MKKKYFKYVLAVLIVALLFLFKPFTNTVKDAIINFSSFIVRPFNSIVINVDEQNNARIEALTKENMELRAALEVDESISNYKKVNANVIIRNIHSWYNTITLDKGSSVGIKKEQAVISENGLIGSVMEVTKETATVRLLTSNDLRRKISVSVKNGETYLYGLLTNYNNFYKVDSITDNMEIEVGSSVYTTGFGNLFPAGLKIGTVDRVEKDQFDLARVVYVDPISNLENINYVSVLIYD